MEGRVWILGATGFVGRHLAAHLAGSRRVIALGSSACNLLAWPAAREALSGVGADDVLVMASAITRLRDNSFGALSANLKMAHTLCRLLATRPPAHVVYLSTVEVYGKAGLCLPLTEASPVNPDNFYAVSKLACEYLLANAAKPAGLPLTILRLPGIYGPGDKGNSTIGALVGAARHKGEIDLFGGGRARRDYVSVEDVCRTVGMALERRPVVTLNVVTGKSHRIAEIAAWIAAAMPGRVHLRHVPPEAGEQAGEDMIFDTSRLHRAFPDLALEDLSRGLRRYLEHRAD